MNGSFNTSVIDTIADIVSITTGILTTILAFLGLFAFKSISRYNQKRKYVSDILESLLRINSALTSVYFLQDDEAVDVHFKRQVLESQKRNYFELDNLLKDKIKFEVDFLNNSIELLRINKFKIKEFWPAYSTFSTSINNLSREVNEKRSLVLWRQPSQGDFLGISELKQETQDLINDLIKKINKF